MSFIEDVKGLWREASTTERIVMVVTAPLLLVAYWLAYIFDTDRDD